MATQHSQIQSADCHEPIHFTTASTSDAGKVLTPSSSAVGTSVLRQLAVADLSDATTALAGKAALTPVVTQTLSNTKIAKRIDLQTYAATLTFTVDHDLVGCDSLTGNVTIAAFTGSPSQGDEIIVRLTNDGAGAHTVTWDASQSILTAISVVASKTTTWRLMWNATISKWQEIGAAAGT